MMRYELERARAQRQSYFKAESLSRKAHFAIDEVRSNCSYASQLKI